MKDLELNDILNKQDGPLTRLSAYFNGSWSWATLVNPTKIGAEQSFYRINYPFGLHKNNSSDPAKYYIKGNPGEYVSSNKQGTLDLVTEFDYAQLFPTLQDIPTTPPSSNQLSDPNFLTKTQQESVDKDSDMVMIGDKAFSLPTTTKKTITVIETLTGQAQVYYNESTDSTDSSGLPTSTPTLRETSPIPTNNPRIRNISY